MIASTTVVASSVAPSPPPTATGPTDAPPELTGPLEFVDGALLGIRQGSLLTDAVSAFGVEPMTVSGAELTGPVYACIGTADPMVIRSGGLTFVFEHSTPDDDYLLTNWQYVGGPAAGFAEILAPFGVSVGDARSELEAANPDFADYGDEIDVGQPFYLRYGVENDTVNWFGIIDCAFESIPADE